VLEQAELRARSYDNPNQSPVRIFEFREALRIRFYRHISGRENKIVDSREPGKAVQITQPRGGQTRAAISRDQGRCIRNDRQHQIIACSSGMIWRSQRSAKYARVRSGKRRRRKQAGCSRAAWRDFTSGDDSIRKVQSISRRFPAKRFSKYSCVLLPEPSGLPQR